MSLPEITVPEGVPPFRADGHAMQPRSPFVDVQMGTGHGRKRRTRRTAPTTASVAVRMTGAAMQAFDAWWENDLQKGARRFSARLFGLETSTPQWWEALWKGVYNAVPSNGAWLVTGQLRLFGEPSVDGPASTSALGEIVVPLLAIAHARVSGAAAGEIVISLEAVASAAGEIVIALSTPIADSRITTTGDRRVTSTGDRRVLAGP
jgi:hypothetical protein